MSAPSLMSAVGSIGGIIGAGSGLAYQKNILSPMLKDVGQAEAREVRRFGREVGGKQAAGYGKAGVRLDVGTPVQVMAKTAARSELAALRTMFAYKQRIYEMEHQAQTKLAMSLLMLGGSVGAGIMSMAGSGGQGGMRNLYGKHGSAVSTIPSPYSVDYGKYA